MTAQLPAGNAGGEGEDGDAVRKSIESQLAEQVAMKARLENEALSALKISPAKTKKSEVLTKHIGEAAKKDPSVMVHVIRSWLTESDR